MSTLDDWRKAMDGIDELLNRMEDAYEGCRTAKKDRDVAAMRTQLRLLRETIQDIEELGVLGSYPDVEVRVTEAKVRQVAWRTWMSKNLAYDTTPRSQTEELHTAA